MLSPKTVIEIVTVEQLALHREVDKETRDAFATVIHYIGGYEILSKEALILLAKLHPIHAIRSNRGNYWCFAGLRIYQLAKAHLQPDSKLPILVHPNQSDDVLQNMVALDSYLSFLAFGLDGHAWPADLLAIWQQIDKYQLKILTPKLSNKAKLAKTIGADRKKLYKRGGPPKSEIQEICDKNIAVDNLEHDEESI